MEELPFPTDTFDRYVSAGSIEYWPEPQRAIVEAYRVIKPGGIALIIGPLQRKNPLARWLSDTWMLFPRKTCSWGILAKVPTQTGGCYRSDDSRSFLEFYLSVYYRFCCWSFVRTDSNL